MRLSTLLARLLLITLLLSVSLNVSARSDYATYKVALSNFTYEAEPEGEDVWQVFDSVDVPFASDCEDFALTLQKQIGGKVWMVLLDKGVLAEGTPRLHAVLVKEGKVYDNIYHDVKWRECYPAMFVKILN